MNSCKVVHGNTIHAYLSGVNCVHDSIILLRAVLSPNLSQVMWSQLLSTHHILVSLFASANEHRFILFYIRR